MMENLVEVLCSEGWSTTQAWAAAQDADNWLELVGGSVQAQVIATIDQYDGQLVDMGGHYATVASRS